MSTTSENRISTLERRSATLQRRIHTAETRLYMLRDELSDVLADLDDQTEQHHLTRDETRAIIVDQLESADLSGMTFNQVWRIWEGTDFPTPEALRISLRRWGHPNLAALQ